MQNYDLEYVKLKDLELKIRNDLIFYENIQNTNKKEQNEFIKKIKQDYTNILTALNSAKEKIKNINIVYDDFKQIQKDIIERKDKSFCLLEKAEKLDNLFKLQLEGYKEKEDFLNIKINEFNKVKEDFAFLKNSINEELCKILALYEVLKDINIKDLTNDKDKLKTLEENIIYFNEKLEEFISKEEIKQIQKELNKQDEVINDLNNEFLQVKELLKQDKKELTSSIEDCVKKADYESLKKLVEDINLNNDVIEIKELLKQDKKELTSSIEDCVKKADYESLKKLVEDINLNNVDNETIANILIYFISCFNSDIEKTKNPRKTYAVKIAEEESKTSIANFVKVQIKKIESVKEEIFLPVPFLSRTIYQNDTNDFLYIYEFGSTSNFIIKSTLEEIKQDDILQQNNSCRMYIIPPQAFFKTLNNNLYNAYYVAEHTNLEPFFTFYARNFFLETLFLKLSKLNAEEYYKIPRTYIFKEKVYSAFDELIKEYLINNNNLDEIYSILRYQHLIIEFSNYAMQKGFLR